MWNSVLQHVEKLVQQLRANHASGSEPLRWITEGKLQLATRRIYARIGEIDALFIDLEGFFGVFKHYGGSPTNMQAITRDLYYLAQFRHEEAIDIGMMAADGVPSLPGHGGHTSKAPQRLWTYHLFAGLSTEPTEAASEHFAKDLYDGRLTEEIGLSLLFTAGPAVSDEDRDKAIVKFTSPLFLKLRSWKEQDPLRTWRGSLMESLQQMMFKSRAETENVRDLDVAAHERLHQAIAHVLNPTEAVPSPAIRMRRIDDIRIRRFEKLPKALPFGAITLVHGPNGSGKTSLLDGIELAMTGQIHRIEQALNNLETDRKQNANRGKMYVDLLTPMATGGEDMPRNAPSHPERVDGTHFGSVAVERDEGTGGQDVTSLPMRYEQPSEDTEDQRAVTARRSYYLAQGDLKRFVTAPSTDRYVWMTEVANVPLEQVRAHIQLLRSSVRKAITERWQWLTNRRLPPTSASFYEAGVNDVRRISHSATQRVKRALTGLQHCSRRLAVDGGLLDWYLKATDGLPDAEALLNQYETDFSIVTDTIASKSISDREQERLAAALHRVMQHIPTVILLENSLTTVQHEIQNMSDAVADILPEIDARLPSTKSAGEKSADASPPKQPAHAISPEDRRALEAQGRTIAGNALTATHARRVAQTMNGLVRHIDNTVRQLAPLPNPDELTWADHAQDTAARYAEFHARIAALLRNLKAAGDHLRWLDGEAQYWTDTENRFVQERDRWASAMQSLAGEDAKKPDPLSPEQRGRIEQFLFKAGHVELAKQFALNPDDRRTLENVREIMIAHKDLLATLADRTHDKEHDRDLAELHGLLRDWHRVDEDLNRCGLGTLLHCLDVINAKEQEIIDVVSTNMGELLKTRVGDLWVELVGALTAHLWNYPLPRFEMEGEEGKRGKGKQRKMVIATDLGANKSLPADAVFNMGELHVLGLAWFLLSYILEGVRYSNTMILDDPFQSLDDVNVSTVVRNVLEIIRLADIEQVVLALHQPGIVDYIRQEVASPLQHPSVNGESNGKAARRPRGKPGENTQPLMYVAEWVVEPVDPHRSRAIPKLHILRKDVRERPPMLDDVPLGDMGIPVNGVQHTFFSDP